ncbi:MAG: hypothetical protein ACYC5K_12685 [Saccharofermentanales bacterium]
MSPLAIVNVIILIGLVTFPALIEINKRALKGKNKTMNKIIMNGRKIHPIMGLVLIASGLVHGYLKLDGVLQLHTGLLLVLALMCNAVLGFIYKKKRKRPLAVAHRIVGVLIVVAFFVHYLNPWLLG